VGHDSAAQILNITRCSTVLRRPQTAPQHSPPSASPAACAAQHSSRQRRCLLADLLRGLRLRQAGGRRTWKWFAWPASASRCGVHGAGDSSGLPPCARGAPWTSGARVRGAARMLRSKLLTQAEARGGQVWHLICWRGPWLVRIVLVLRESQDPLGACLLGTHAQRACAAEGLPARLHGALSALATAQRVRPAQAGRLHVPARWEVQCAA